MAATLCDSPLLNHYHPSLSSFPSKSITANRNNYQKSQLGSFFPGAKTSKWTSNRNRRMRVTASLGGLLGGIFKGTDTGESTRQQYANTVNIINGLEAEMSALSDSHLREKTSVLKERAQLGESLDSILPVRYPILQFSLCFSWLQSCKLLFFHEAFAVVRQASKRVLGLRPLDVQLIGGMVLHKGEIAEMRTGEGKTLVAILPGYLNALSGKGVHIFTVNNYLARKDCEWVGQGPRFLGLKRT